MRSLFYDLKFDFGSCLFDRNGLLSGTCRFYGIFKENVLAGFGKIVDHQGYMAGLGTNLRYFGNFFIHPDFQRQGLFTRLIEFMIMEFESMYPPGVGYFVFLNGNNPVDRFFKIKAGQVKNMPLIREYSEFVTKSLIITRKKNFNPNGTIRLAAKSDRAKIEGFMAKNRGTGSFMPLDFNYHSASEYAILESSGRITAICELLDLGNYKKTRITKFKKGSYLFFLLMRILQATLKLPQFPRKGEAFRELYINQIIRLDDEDAESALDLIRWAFNFCCENKYNLLHLGLGRRDPLISRLKGFLSISITAKVLTVHPTSDKIEKDPCRNLNSPSFPDFKIL
nr:GNAT family N-acetyltransferase [Robiginitalea sp. SC105]